MSSQFDKAKRFFEEGTAALERRELSKAIELLTQSLGLLPGRESTQNNLAATHLLLGSFREAESISVSVLAQNPDSYEASVNLIAAFNMSGDYESAIDKSRALCAKNPGIAAAWNLMGIALEKTSQYSEAIAAYETAIKISPLYAEAHQNLALLDLFEQRFDQGWARYEWRWKNPSYQAKRLFQSPSDPWDFKTPLLIWNEHGLGDQLIYCSFLPDTLELIEVPLVLICNPKLCPVFKDRFQAERVSVLTVDEFESSSMVHDNFYAIPMASLPIFLWRYYRHPTTPAGGAYLSNLRRLRTKWQDGASSSNHGRKIGISWRSFNPQFESSKSIPLPRLIDGLTGCFDGDAALIDLQYGDVESEWSEVRQSSLHCHRTSHVDKTNDLMGLAGLIASCDVVVTVSNTTAHIAGAIGVPCLVLVGRGMSRFWYWHDLDGHSPWYSSVKLYEMEPHSGSYFINSDLQEALVRLLEIQP